MSLYDWYLLTASIFFTIFSVIAVGIVAGVIVAGLVIRQSILEAQKQMQAKFAAAEKLKLNKGLWYLVQLGFMWWRMKTGRK